MSEYLLADAQPAMRMPITEIDDTARAKKMPTSRSANHGVGAEGDDGVDSRNVRHQHDDRRQALKTQRSARSGTRSSFWSELADLGEQLQRAVGDRPPSGRAGSA